MGLWHPRDKVLRYFWHSKFCWHHHWWSTSAALVDGDWSTTLDQKLLKISWRLSISSSDLIKESIFSGGVLYQHIHLLFPPWAFSGLPSLRDRQSGRYIHLVIFLLFSKSFDLKIAKVTFCNLYYAQIGNLPGSLLRLQRGILVNEIKFLPNSISTTRHGKCLWIILWTSLDVTLIQKLWPTSLPTDLTKRWLEMGRKSTVLNKTPALWIQNLPKTLQLLKIGSAYF